MPRFDPSHPSTLAIYCSDGRFTHAVEDHCEDLGHARIDTMTLPGGRHLRRHHSPGLKVGQDLRATGGDGAQSLTPRADEN